MDEDIEFVDDEAELDDEKEENTDKSPSAGSLYDDLVETINKHDDLALDEIFMTIQLVNLEVMKNYMQEDKDDKEEPASD